MLGYDRMGMTVQIAIKCLIVHVFHQGVSTGLSTEMR